MSLLKKVARYFSWKMHKAGLALVAVKPIFESLKHLAEILAITFAGVWIWYRFTYIESPASIPIIAGTNSSVVTEVSPTKVEVLDKIQLKNSDKKSFKIDSIRFEIRSLPFDSIINYAFFDANFYIKNSACDYSFIDTSSPLCRYYPANSIAENCYEFYFIEDWRNSVLISYYIYGDYCTGPFNLFTEKLQNGKGYIFIKHAFPD